MCEVTESDGLDADFCLLLLPGRAIASAQLRPSTVAGGTPCCRRRAASLRADQALMGDRNGAGGRKGRRRTSRATDARRRASRLPLAAMMIAAIRIAAINSTTEQTLTLCVRLRLTQADESERCLDDR